MRKVQSSRQNLEDGDVFENVEQSGYGESPRSQTKSETPLSLILKDVAEGRSIAVHL